MTGTPSEPWSDPGHNVMDDLRQAGIDAEVAYGRLPASREPTVEFGVRLPDGRVVRGPGWTCEGDVIAASYAHGNRPGGDLVVSVNGAVWTTVRRQVGP